MASCLQKSSLLTEKEDRLTVINAKILEIKKKMQLSEGQRKSHHEESEAEKRHNNERIEALKKEIKARSQELANLRNSSSDQAKRHASELPPIVTKNTDKIVENLDLKVIEQRKQLDLLRYEKRKKKKLLKTVERDYEEMLIELSKAGAIKVGDVDAIKKRISYLENEVHRVEVQLNEAELVKKKYSVIKQELLTDAVKFESSMGQVQEMIDRQNAELQKLEAVNAEAVEMRTRALTTLSYEQAEETEANEIRRQEVNYFKERFKERQTELEQLEKKIFPAQARTMMQDEQNEMDEQMEESQEPDPKILMHHAVCKLIVGLGVLHPHEVVERLRSQKDITMRLHSIRDDVEEERKELQLTYSSLKAQLDAYKFADDDEDYIKQEKIKALKEKIENEDEKKKALKVELEEKNNLLLEIKKTLYDLCGTMDIANDSPPLKWTSSLADVIELAKIATKRYQACKELAENLGEVPPKVLEIKEKLSSSKRTPRKPDAVDVEDDEEPVMTYQEFVRSLQEAQSESSGEEEEIPTRSFLKRQAQIIVDTKTRRRGGRYNKK